MPAANEPPGNSLPAVIWDIGTAYDLFISLTVLHEPAKYGLRGAWAKGVRARLSVGDREVLEQSLEWVWPLGWVHTLAEPKDGLTALRALEEIPPAERLSAISMLEDVPQEVREALHKVAARGTWGPSDRSVVRSAIQDSGAKKLKAETLTAILEGWSRPAEFGERYLAALHSYYDAFFAEEEMRIQPALEEALRRAKERSTRLRLPALLEELSQGLRLSELPSVPEVVLAPSFWSTPLLVFARVHAERHLYLFGARPADASLVPGEVVPDALMRALKALGDPTRLRILRHLAEEPMSPAQLARRLRLRAPTVIHHLDVLRMAQLVHLTLGAGEKRRYAARPRAVAATFGALEGFLCIQEEPTGAIEHQEM
jgi:DNA-binding transcriptional ArsR family regulator